MNTFTVMIALGVPYRKIVKEIRRTTNNERGKYIERQDIINVAYKHGLAKPYAYHENDEKSTEILIRKLGYACLFHKPRGETNQYKMPKDDFVVIICTPKQQKVFQHYLHNTENVTLCMDSTHGISSLGYHLT